MYNFKFKSDVCDPGFTTKTVKSDVFDQSCTISDVCDPRCTFFTSKFDVQCFTTAVYYVALYHINKNCSVAKKKNNICSYGFPCYLFV